MRAIMPVSQEAVGPTLVQRNGKKRRCSDSLNLMKKLSVTSASLAPPSFEAALEKSFAESGAKRTGCDPRIAPVFQMGYQ